MSRHRGALVELFRRPEENRSEVGMPAAWRAKSLVAREMSNLRVAQRRGETGGICSVAHFWRKKKVITARETLRIIAALFNAEVTRRRGMRNRPAERRRAPCHESVARNVKPALSSMCAKSKRMVALSAAKLRHSGGVGLAKMTARSPT